MKITGKELFELSGIYQKLFQSIDFKTLKEAREFTKAMQKFDEEMTTVYKIRDKIMEGKDISKKKDATEVSKKVSELFSQEFEMDSVVKIKESYVDGVITKASEIMLLDKLELIEDEKARA